MWDEEMTDRLLSPPWIVFVIIPVKCLGLISMKKLHIFWASYYGKSGKFMLLNYDIIHTEELKK